MEIFDNSKDYGLSSTSFEMVRKDTNVKIKDAKFESKPTTFAKDAFRRFCKNKSSVAGAVIIAILLAASFLYPAISPYDVSPTSTYLTQALLPPKLNKSGTGFWDGTKNYKHIVYDQVNECPADFIAHAVTKINVGDVEYTNIASKYGRNGYIALYNDKVLAPGASDDSLNGFFLNYTDFKVTSSGNYVAKLGLGTKEGQFEEAEMTDYRVRLQYKDSDSSTKYLELADWSSNYTDQTYDLSSALTAAGISEIEKAKVRVEIKAKETKTFLLIRSAEIVCLDATENENLAGIGFTDANKAAMVTRNEDGSYDKNYWQSNVFRHVYNVEMKYCDFTYDAYDAVFGSNEMVIGQSIMNEYKAKGWCEYDFAVGPSSFVKLSEECPVDSVEEQHYDVKNSVYQLDTHTTYYKYIGLKKAPTYLLGTDAKGHDLVTKALKSLRTSLLVATIATVVSLAIGLVWGAIAGYFGGTTDIVMERFTEIISGVPWIVMMTLVILLLGNSIVTFAIALCMTDWIGPAATTRTQFYRFKGREYVLASRTLGASDWRLIFQHILPNGLGTIVTSVVLMIPGCIFSEASISYLGLGLKGVNSFGVLLSENQAYLNSFPALIIFPAIIISLLMISFNLFGNGLRDALNPSLKGGE